MPPDRSAYSILVPSAHATGGIGIIRSLGAAGYRVHAAAADPNALGLRSRFAAARAVHPPVPSPEFREWLRDYIRHQAIAMVMPGWDLKLLREPAISEFSALFPVSSAPDVLAAACSKADLFAHLLEGDGRHRANLPPSLLVDLDQDVPSERVLGKLPLPLFIKLDGSLARRQKGDAVIRVASAAEAQRRLEALAEHYRRALVQGYVPGRGAGAFVLRWDGRTFARMMHLRLHEMPHTGGASSLRRTWWHDAMMEDAEIKLAHLGWEGIAMVEYRWDAATDRFYLMEMNLRFWGSLHLALYAGVDFPRLLADAFLLDRMPDQMVVNRREVICRNTFPYEIGYLVSLWRDPAVSLARKVGAGIEAIALSIDPRIRTDLFYPGDRSLYFKRIKDMIAGTRTRL